MQICQHIRSLFQNLIIPVAQHLITAGFEERRAPSVVLSPLNVLPAIQFYNELDARCCKVHHERPHRQLTAELAGSQPPAAQMLPQECFGIAGPLPQLPGQRDVRPLHWELRVSIGR